MRVYIIKNKEGKYFERGLSNFYNPNFCEEHYFYETKQDAEKSIEFYRLKDCEPVEITIAEGNLEQQLAIIKRALLKASKEAFGNKISFVNSNYSKKITNSEEYAEYLIFETESEVKNGN